MNLLQVAPYSAYPPFSGGQWRIHGLMLGYGDDDHVRRAVTESIGPSSIRHIGSNQIINIERGYTEHRISSLTLSATNALSRVVFGSANIHASNFFEPYAMGLSAATEYASLFNWADMIMVEHPWQFGYVAKRVENVPLVYSSHNVEVELYADMDDRYVTKPFYRLLHRLERHAVCNADLVVTTSERDRATFQTRYDPNTSFHVAPNATLPVESAPSAGGVSLPGVDERSIVACFAGSDHHPNVDAVENLASIARSLTDEQIEFVVIGAVCDRFDPDELPETVHLLGFVDDFNGYLRSCDVALNPITMGSGTNVKVPEYMSHGLPVISTPFGARGIPTTDGEDILIRELSAFPRTLIDFRSGDIDAADLSARAKHLVETELNWRTISGRLFKRLRQLSD